MAKKMTQKEIDDRLAAGEKPKRAKKSKKSKKPVITYDFKHPNRVSKDQRRTLENLHTNLARMISSSLSTMTQSVVDCDIAFVDQTTYAEVIMSMTNPSLSYTFTIEPLGGPAFLDFAPDVAYGLIDCEFGGTGEVTPPNRPVTAIERTVMTRVVTRTLADFEATWLPLLKVQVSDAELETNPEFMQIAAPSDTVVLIAFEVNAKNFSGLVYVCYPYFTLEPVTPYLNVQTWASRLGRRSEPQEARLNQLGQIPTEIRVIAGRGEVPAEDIANAKVGDTIVLSTRADDLAVLFVEDEPLFRVHTGMDEKKHRYSVEVEQAIPIEERIHYV